MKKITEIRSKNLRRDRNTDLIRRMRNGEQTSSFNSFASWFPPRPIIEKDKAALGQLYSAESELPLVEKLKPEDSHPVRLA